MKSFNCASSATTIETRKNKSNKTKQNTTKRNKTYAKKEYEAKNLMNEKNK